MRLRSRHNKNDGEWSIVALEKAVKNPGQSDKILDNSPKGDSQSSGAAENAVREAEGMIHTLKMSVEEKFKAVIDNKHVLLSWLVIHARVITTRYKTVHDGKPAYQRPRWRRPRSRFGWMLSGRRARRAQGPPRSGTTQTWTDRRVAVGLHRDFGCLCVQFCCGKMRRYDVSCCFVVPCL